MNIEGHLSEPTITDMGTKSGEPDSDHAFATPAQSRELRNSLVRLYNLEYGPTDPFAEDSGNVNIPCAGIAEKGETVFLRIRPYQGSMVATVTTLKDLRRGSQARITETVSWLQANSQASYRRIEEKDKFGFENWVEIGHSIPVLGLPTKAWKKFDEAVRTRLKQIEGVSAHIAVEATDEEKGEDVALRTARRQQVGNLLGRWRRSR